MVVKGRIGVSRAAAQPWEGACLGEVDGRVRVQTREVRQVDIKSFPAAARQRRRESDRDGLPLAARKEPASLGLSEGDRGCDCGCETMRRLVII